MAQDVLARHQIWLVDKTRREDSRLYSLLEFKPRKEESIRTGYLLGRYGAVPTLETVSGDDDEAQVLANQE